MLSEVAAPFEEHFDHALADARVDLEADIAVGHRVVVAFDAHMAVRRDLAVDPLAPLSAARGRGWRTARSFASNTARRVSPHAIRAWLSRSSSRRMAAFIASSEKKVWWRSASRMRDWTAPTQASTSPLSAACPERARSTATRAGCGIGRRLSAHVPDPVDSSGSIVRDHKRAVGCLQDVGRPSPPSPISVSGNGVQAPLIAAVDELREVQRDRERLDCAISWGGAAAQEIPMVSPHIGFARLGDRHLRRSRGALEAFYEAADDRPARDGVRIGHGVRAVHLPFGCLDAPKPPGVQMVMRRHRRNERDAKPGESALDRRAAGRDTQPGAGVDDPLAGRKSLQSGPVA